MVININCADIGYDMENCICFVKETIPRPNQPVYVGTTDHLV